MRARSHGESDGMGHPRLAHRSYRILSQSPCIYIAPFEGAFITNASGSPARRIWHGYAQISMRRRPVTKAAEGGYQCVRNHYFQTGS